MARRLEQQALARLEAGEDDMLGPLNALHVLQDRVAATKFAEANTAAQQAFTVAVVRGVLAVLAVGGFAVFAVSLVRKINAQNRALRRADEMKSEFVSLISHELRTPLTSIRGYVELILDGEAGDVTKEQRDFLRIVDRNSERLLRLVGDLLFVAQVESGKLAMVKAGSRPGHARA